MNNDEFEKSLDMACLDLIGRSEDVVRLTVLRLFEGVVMRSAVGNPDIWAVNTTAREYNLAVADENARLRAEGGGRIEQGRKVHDSMEIKKPAGYTGGRYRGNWQLAMNTPTIAETGRIDKSGTRTISAARGVMAGLDIDKTQTIWFINNAPYSYVLEVGHSQQQPNGNARLALVEFPQVLAEVIAEVGEK